MTLRQSLIAAVSLTFLLSLTSCGGSKKDTGSELIEMSVTDGGLILPTANPTCADTSGARSATAPSLLFGALRVTWKPKDQTLFVGLIRITVTSNNIGGGKYIVTLPTDEISLLLGASGSTILPAAAGDKVITSNLQLNREGYPNCGLVVGGLKLVDGTEGKRFVAGVLIELIGEATDGAGKVTVVRKNYSTTATAY